ncbi:MAG: hypothetical protein PHO07_20185 [Pirellulales bacterium]|jgi:nitroreductase|nr:hypothetical protein [Thermoguttaceae bacterium]MDD4789496.1 hypothetical protein [Pirellulales bacterium]NLZ00448.1 hypothetical protein [Pirellulaceae bacterium]
MADPSSRQSTAAFHKELVAAAVLAPTPDNNQPWRFSSQGDRLLIDLDRRRALPSDVNGMFDLVGVGAAIENAAIAARQSDCELKAEYHGSLDGLADETLRRVATLTCSGGGEPDPLHPFLSKRCTSRKMYSTRPVDPEALARLGAEVVRFRGIQLEWIAERRRIRAFARVVASSDQYRFQYRPFHEEIFRQLRFTPAEAEATRDGLDLRSLELPPGTGLLLRWMRPWHRMQWLQRLRVDRALTFPSLLSVWKSGALGALSVPEPGLAQFVDGGRAFQRLWLAVAREGLSLHPLGSLPVFLAHLEQLAGEKINAAHQKLAARLGTRLRELVPSTRGRTLLMLFRIGHASPPSVGSLRRPVEEVMDLPG